MYEKVKLKKKKEYLTRVKKRTCHTLGCTTQRGPSHPTRRLRGLVCLGCKGIACIACYFVIIFGPEDEITALHILLAVYVCIIRIIIRVNVRLSTPFRIRRSESVAIYTGVEWPVSRGAS